MAPSRSPVLEAIIANLNSTSRSDGFFSMSWKAASYSASSAAETVAVCARAERVSAMTAAMLPASSRAKTLTHRPNLLKMTFSPGFP